jgi:hypothetical protein
MNDSGDAKLLFLHTALVALTYKSGMGSLRGNASLAWFHVTFARLLHLG